MVSPMSSSDAKPLIESAVRNFLEEVPALAPMKLVVGLDLQGRGDTQQFRIEMPELKVTKDIGTDARVRVEMRRDFFNAMVEAGAKVADWREAFMYGKAKATGVEQYLRLIEQVVEKAEERQRLRRARAH
jgi:pyruvate-formate lyase